MREEDLSIRELTENPALFDALQKSAEQPISLEVKKIEEEKGWHKGLLNAMQLVEKEKETRERLDPIQESVENVRVLERGSYELDISSLMKGDPLIVRTRSGIYYIRIPAKLP
jgi:predicted  nucleic acid-binding Zn-ribbon protein